MARKKAALIRVAKEARYAAVNAIFTHMTDAERRQFGEWHKKNRDSSAFEWPGLKPYLAALAEDIDHDKAA
jgi:hypothetical protein